MAARAVMGAETTTMVVKKVVGRKSGMEPSSRNAKFVGMQMHYRVIIARYAMLWIIDKASVHTKMTQIIRQKTEKLGCRYIGTCNERVATNGSDKRHNTWDRG